MKYQNQGESWWWCVAALAALAAAGYEIFYFSQHPTKRQIDTQHCEAVGGHWMRDVRGDYFCAKSAQ